MHNFYSVYTSTPADSQPVPQPQQPAVPGISNCSPSVQQINVSATIVSNNAPLVDTQPRHQNPGPTPSHRQEQSKHRIPVELPQPRALTDPIAFSKGMPGKANQPTNELPMNSYRYNIPAPIIPVPPPVQKDANFEKTFGQIGKFSVQLIWYKQVETLGEHVSTWTTTTAVATWCGTGDSSATHVRLIWRRDSTSVSSLLLTQGCTPWRSSTSP